MSVDVEAMARELFDAVVSGSGLSDADTVSLWNALHADTDGSGVTAAQSWQLIAERAIALGATFMTPTDRALQADIIQRGGTGGAELAPAVAALRAQLGHGADGLHVPPDTTDLAELLTLAAAALEMERRRSKEALGDRAALMAAWERLCTAVGAKDEDGAMAMVAAQADANAALAASRGEALARVAQLEAEIRSYERRLMPNGA